MPDTKQVTVSGFDADSNGKLVPAHLTYDMSGGPGVPISVYAFKKMVKRYIDNATQIGDTNRTAVVDFCRESILRVLCQTGCEGIRFWFCIPETGEGVSLALQGINAEGNPLNPASTSIDFTQSDVPAQQHQKSDPRLEEKGNGKSVKQIIGSNKQRLEFLQLNNQQIIEKALAEEWKS